MNDTTPKSMRLQIAFFGRTNVGKSSVINLIAKQNVSIVSNTAGTTTDIVEKSMELRPVGPVVLIDTAGLDDTSTLAAERIAKTEKIFNRADIFVIVTEEGKWDDHEKRVAAEAKKRNAPIIAIINKTDITPASENFKNQLAATITYIIECSCTESAATDRAIENFRAAITDCAKFSRAVLGDDNPAIAADLVPPNSTVILVVPIDSGAPQGRLILPQVQTLRDLLDGGHTAIVVRDTEYEHTLKIMRDSPALVICDSQAVKKIADQTPSNIALTTFSLLFARMKGDIEIFANGAKMFDNLKIGDKILIAEACSHHAAGDDIGRVKIPNLLKKFIGKNFGNDNNDSNLQIDFYNGRDFPQDLSAYKLVLHCGGCMLTRREMLERIRIVNDAGVAICNYGMAISYLNSYDIFDRVLQPFKK